MSEIAVMRRLFLLVDIERDSHDEDSFYRELDRRLDSVLDGTLHAAEVAINRTARRKHGGGRLVLLPIGVDKVAVVPLLLRGLLSQLEGDCSPSIPLRLCAVIAEGVVTRTKSGYAGRALVAAKRLLDSKATREELKNTPAALFVLAVYDDIYREVLTRGDFTAEAFSHVVIDLPGQQPDHAWVRAWARGAVKPPPNRRGGTLRDALVTAAGAVSELADDLSSHSETETAATESVESHEVVHEVVAYTGADHHTYIVEHFGSHEEHAGVDYESSGFSGDSSGDSY